MRVSGEAGFRKPEILWTLPNRNPTRTRSATFCAIGRLSKKRKIFDYEYEDDYDWGQEFFSKKHWSVRPTLGDALWFCATPAGVGLYVWC